LKIDARLTKANYKCNSRTHCFHEELKTRSNSDHQAFAHLPGSRLVKSSLCNFLNLHVCRRISKISNINIFLILMFGLLHIADGAVTYFGLKFASVIEVNPILNYCAELFGLGCSITVLKFGILAVIGFLYYERHKMNSCLSTFTLVSAVGFYLWVVSNNVFLVVGS
jgi:uncharacterized membrane protein